MPPLLQNELFSKWFLAFEVSLRLYIEFCKNEPRISVKYHLVDSNIKVYEMPIDLHRLTTIQIYLAIKLYSSYQNNTFALLAVLYLYSNQNSTTHIVVKSFKTAPFSNHSQIYLQNIIQNEVITSVRFEKAPCDGANIGKYQLAISTNLLFNSIARIKSVSDNFTIDLWRLQDAIFTI
ncbi:5319_t:CDS:2 [Cetraspora pellucida]|uniref:5319_t:CDS:1 n=1 Tax=Cetraspora pellucida TaxID=1433469 RepID=A0A9N9HRJ2_9GLOM|nr:5319_t:CDS:2 [Cetraspora pellucida]